MPNLITSGNPQTPAPFPAPPATQVGMTYADNDQRTNTLAMVKLLEHVQPDICMGNFAQVHSVPKSKANNVMFRRPVPWGTQETKIPVQEGVVPSAHMMSWEDVQVYLNQYAGVAKITDLTVDLAEDNALDVYMKLSAEQAAQTMEELLWGVVVAGTSVIYDTSAHTQRSAVDSAISSQRLRLAARTLHGQGAKMITERLAASSIGFNTWPIEASWVVFTHTDQESDVRDLPGFRHISAYGSYRPIDRHEIGSWESFRFLMTRHFEPFPGAGSGTLNGMKSVGGSNVDVYPVMVTARHAFGTTPLRGRDRVQTFVVPPSRVDKSDPIGQFGFVSWKFLGGFVRLNELFMQRIEVGATDL